jgi:RNA polymerase sigma-70 factor (ECF subfamily)
LIFFILIPVFQEETFHLFYYCYNPCSFIFLKLLNASRGNMRKFNQFIPDEDAPLLLSLHRGDLFAFETLIWKYQKRVFNLALLLTGVQKTACEVAENSFLTAYQNIRSLKSTARFSSWLAALALKECRELNDYRDEEPESPPDPDPDDVSSYSAAVHKKLELCIRELPFELSELILLRYVRGYSLDRIEEILQINGDLLLSRLFEAQQTLACWLKSDTENPAELSVMKTADSSIHPEIRRNFSAYLDNSTEDDEKELTKSHLKSCGSCREALAELEWMVEDIKSIPDVEPPHWLASSIMQKVKSYPQKPAGLKTPSHLRIQMTVAAIFIVIIGASSYLLLKRTEPGLEMPGSVNPPPASPSAGQKVEPAGTGFTSILKGVFKGTVNSPGSSPKSESAPRASVPLPAALPSEPPAQATPPTAPAQSSASGKSEQTQKREKSDLTPALPHEWGDPPPQTRAQQRKAPLPRARGGEIAVVLTTADPVAAAHDIENAVSSIGGKVNGRAYSGGADILYTRVEVDKFFDLMSRLGKIGRIQELPQLPEGAEGDLDLIIRW